MPASVNIWHLFRQLIICSALRALRSRYNCAEGPMIVSLYIGSRGNSTISGLGLTSVSKMIFSVASKANWYCTFHFSRRRVSSSEGLSQKAPIPRVVCVLAGCAMSHFIILLSKSLRVVLFF